MKLLTLNTNEINQNGYHINKLTRNKIGFIYIAPANIIPDDCLACDGYVLKISDYKKLYLAIGKTYNTGVENDDEFRIPDYNITGRFLQPGANVGSLVEAGLPQHTHSGTTSDDGAHIHTAKTAGLHLHFVMNGNTSGSDVSASNSLSIVGAQSGGYNAYMLDGTTTTPDRGKTNSSGEHTHTINSCDNHNHTFVTLNASSSIYKEQATVQPPSQIVHLCIKYK